MSFPYIFEANFEAGDNSEFDSEQDTGSLLDFPHYSTLAKLNGMEVPFRGAHCMRVVMGDTNDHTVTEGDINIADAGTAYFRFYLFAHDDVTATADDVFSIFELQQAGGTPELTCGMRITAATNLLEIGIGDGTAPSSYVEFPRGRWVCVELQATVSTAGAGTFDLHLDGGGALIALTTLTQAAAVGTAQFGTMLTLATTTGTLLFDQFVMDDTRLGPIVDRFRDSSYLTKTAHAFIGPGYIDRLHLQAGAGTDNTVTVYDTDTAYTTDEGNVVYVGGNTVASEAKDFDVHNKVRVQRGAYVVLAGTNPRAIVGFRAASSMSPGVIKSHAARRIPTPSGA